jgi:hypothetical protein
MADLCSRIVLEQRKLQSNSARVLICSRGKGRGHAVPDAAIAHHLRHRRPDWDITFVSYGTGAMALRSLGEQVVDLGLPDDNPIWDTIARLIPVIQENRPTILISHEEFAALPIASAFGVPSVFMSDWFGAANTLTMQSLAHAGEVIVLDDPGFTDLPTGIESKLSWAGPVLRQLQDSGLSKEACRMKLGLPGRAFIVGVMPGSALMHSEAYAPTMDLILNAFDLLDEPGRHLIWVTPETDAAIVEQRLSARSNATLVRACPEIDHIMLSCDVVLTKGNRITTLELAALSIPTISLSWGTNNIDDRRISRVSSNIALRARGLTSDLLAGFILEAVCSQKPDPNLTSRKNEGAIRAAMLLESMVLRAVAQTAGAATADCAIVQQAILHETARPAAFPNGGSVEEGAHDLI